MSWRAAFAIEGRWRRVLDGTVEALYPRRCSGCGLRGVWVCEACLEALPLFKRDLCERCGVPSSLRCRCAYLPRTISGLRSAGPYDGWLREGVHRMKFEGESARAAHLASLMAPHVRAFPNAEALVAVPIHRNRLRERGFNQSDLLARNVSAATGIPVWPALVRTRDTAHQIDLTDDERAENVRDAFSMRQETSMRPVRIILLDDVFTTGATMGECTNVLRDAGVEQVYGLTVC